jgi:hypothetical protein
MRQQPDEDLPVFVKWMEFLKWLLPTTEKFPHKVRFTFANRIDNLALDVVEDLVEARYTSEKRAILKRANLRLEKMRVLLRLSHELRYLSHTSYEYAAKALSETGRMIGGWQKQQEE